MSDYSLTKKRDMLMRGSLNDNLKYDNVIKVKQ